MKMKIKKRRLRSSGIQEHLFKIKNRFLTSNYIQKFILNEPFNTFLFKLIKNNF